LNDRKSAVEDYEKAASLYKKQGRNADTDKDYKNLLQLLKNRR
jgi:hypothetical protein